MYFGVDYYPEHWPRERWQTDAEMMAAAHINVVRMGEFAWALLEPREGKFDFAWLDDAIALAQQYRADGHSASDAAKRAAAETGFRKGEIYRGLGQ